MSWILTRTGQRFDLLAPRASQISTLDIAHALSQLCRFNGHTSRHYSVAQHSLLVASIVPAEHQLAALLHDATEAYVGDMTRPLKALLPDFSSIEHGIWLAICERFQLDPELPACIHEADMVALATERRDLMPEHGENWPCLTGVTPAPWLLPEWTSTHACVQYHSKLLELLSTTHRARARSTWERVDAEHTGAAAPQCL
ncbi:phosphohydrolase [Stutzerimonas degradans]|uniref:Phosphohydrolase n=1 Tax=Stutzerimonas degradans TaxID=2968968 RepID=A0A8E2QGK3_9GAMM|nr:phosphohydrolase [Stutzerimonas degradans]MCQ4274544.1 phosphohydrolase [Stutzerimonas degradans]PNF77971.1 phosphohydrolase [Stutzerimonas degradans]QPT23369.1 phosphohydrolase [Stutzerimonas degradans]